MPDPTAEAQVNAKLREPADAIAHLADPDPPPRRPHHRVQRWTPRGAPVKYRAYALTVDIKVRVPEPDVKGRSKRKRRQALTEALQRKVAALAPTGWDGLEACIVAAERVREDDADSGQDGIAPYEAVAW